MALSAVAAPLRLFSPSGLSEEVHERSDAYRLGFVSW